MKPIINPEKLCHILPCWCLEDTHASGAAERPPSSFCGAPGERHRVTQSRLVLGSGSGNRISRSTVWRGLSQERVQTPEAALTGTRGGDARRWVTEEAEVSFAPVWLLLGIQHVRKVEDAHPSKRDCSSKCLLGIQAIFWLRISLFNRLQTDMETKSTFREMEPKGPAPSWEDKFFFSSQVEACYQMAAVVLVFFSLICICFFKQNIKWTTFF